MAIKMNSRQALYKVAAVAGMVFLVVAFAPRVLAEPEDQASQESQDNGSLGEINRYRRQPPGLLGSYGIERFEAFGERGRNIGDVFKLVLDFELMLRPELLRVVSN